MAYQHDIFISYRRLGATRKWINDIFIPVLNSIISLEIGRDPTYYIDSQVDSGTAWPLAIGKALGNSKTLIPLWSVTYLESEWCKCEISHMLEREVKTGFKTMQNIDGLVFPTIIHDGQSIPVSIAIAQKVDIRDYYVPFMDINSKSVTDLYNSLKPHGVSIARSIQNAPAWQQDWGTSAMNQFYQLFNQLNAPQQDQLPKFIQQ
jgi:hypothetical protein